MESEVKNLRSGFTTGACAAAAAKAAMMVMLGQEKPAAVSISLPGGENAVIPVECIESNAYTKAAVIKDAGDDPDITKGVAITVSLSWLEGNDVRFIAGKGVGTVTKPGLSVPPGEPAVNPVPRRMITDAIRSLSDRGVAVTISIPEGEELAKRTFNPRLGIVGGLSIIGTTGRVRPFSCSAVRESIRCLIEVAAANCLARPVMVPGHIGTRSAKRLLNVQEEDIIEVSNEWGFALDVVKEHGFEKILVLGHPGKLAKLAQGEWDTHSSRSPSALPCVAKLAGELTGFACTDIPTVEGIFSALTPENKRILGDKLAGVVSDAVRARLDNDIPVSVVLVDMKGNLLGQKGDLSPWQ
ncbi:MAG: cobalt-precorrin-5B (C(1))-methyltransferase CbiD [Smithella sp.]